MKIAFLVQAHTNIAQLEILTKVLSSDVSDVYLHLDQKSPEDPTGLTHGTIVPRLPVYHGGFSQVQATLGLIRAAMAHQHYDYYFLLSGQCFPIKPLDWLAAKLDGTSDYINYYPMPREALAKRLDRLEYFYFERHSQLSKFAKLLPKRNFIKGLSLWPYAGSQWWCLRHSTIAYILEYVDRYPRFSRYLRTTSYSDEVFFQSIIANLGIESALKPALFCADFDPETKRPKTYTTADIPLLDARNVFMARKMDINVAPEIVHHYGQQINSRHTTLMQSRNWRER